MGLNCSPEGQTPRLYGKITLLVGGKPANKEILDAELWGISEALNIALKKNISRKACRITAFPDSQATY